MERDARIIRHPSRGRHLRTASGTRVNLENRKSLDVATVLAALDEVRARVAAEAAELGDGQAAA